MSQPLQGPPRKLLNNVRVWLLEKNRLKSHGKVRSELVEVTSAGLVVDSSEHKGLAADCWKLKLSNILTIATSAFNRFKNCLAWKMQTVRKLIEQRTNNVPVGTFKFKNAVTNIRQTVSFWMTVTSVILLCISWDGHRSSFLYPVHNDTTHWTHYTIMSNISPQGSRDKQAGWNGWRRKVYTLQNLVGISAVMLVVFYRRLGMHMTSHRTIMWKRDVIHKTGSTQRRPIATPPEEDRVTATGNSTKIRWSSAVWFLCCASGRTDRQTDILVAIFSTSCGGDVSVNVSSREHKI